MTDPLKRSIVFAPLLGTVLLSGCVWKSDYDKVVVQNQQLQQQNTADEQQIAADKAQISRLQGAIKYTVNSDQLFAPGSWQMSAQGKQIIAKMASQLAPTQQNKLLVTGYTDNAPIGPELQQPGRHLEPGSVAKACRNRDAVSHLARLEPEPRHGAGAWRRGPGCLERYGAGAGEKPASRVDACRHLSLIEQAIAKANGDQHDDAPSAL